MRGTMILGVVLIVLGIAGLLFSHFSYSDTKRVFDAGPIHVNKQEEHHVSIPLIGSIVVLVGGIALVIAGRRTS
jgi:uncharacterized membrane protein